MRTVRATETSVSIWLSQEETPPEGQMLALIRQALAAQGLDPWPETEAECFAAGGDTLIIARPVHPRRPAFYFDDLEALLAGIADCPDRGGSLYTYGDGYLLALPPEASAPALYEHGLAGSVTADWEVHAREQGQCLIRDTAVFDLRRCFSL